MNRTRQLRKVNSLLTVKLLSKPFTKDKTKKEKAYCITVKVSKLPRNLVRVTLTLSKPLRANSRALWRAKPWAALSNGQRGTGFSLAIVKASHRGDFKAQEKLFRAVVRYHTL